MRPKLLILDEPCSQTATFTNILFNVNLRMNPHVDLLAGWSVDWLVGQLNGQLITKRQQSFQFFYL